MPPEYAELHASLGALYIFKNEPRRAIASLEKAIELDPQLAVAYANIALAYAMVEQFNEAETIAHAEYLLGNLTYEEALNTPDGNEITASS